MANELDFMEAKKGLNVRSMLIGVLIGAAAGGIAALLLAPKSGKETRNMMKDRVTDAQQMVKDRVGNIRERVGQVGQSVRTKAEQEMQATSNERTPG